MITIKRTLCPPIAPCLPASYVVEYANGTLIESGTISSGGSDTIIVPNPITCEQATININGVLWGVVDAGATENIIVRQSTGSTQVGAKQGAFYRIDDSDITVNGASFTSVKAEDIKDIILLDQDDNVITPLSLSGDTIKVDIPESGMLPSGTYTPKNAVSGAFDLLWENQTANVVTGDGTIQKTSGATAWDGSATFKIPHNGDFTLRYNGPSADFYSAGINRNKLNNSYEQIENLFLFINGSGYAVYEKNVSFGVYSHGLVEIKRVGNNIEYYTGGVLRKTTIMAGAGAVIFDCSIYSLITISNIQVIIP